MHLVFVIHKLTLFLLYFLLFDFQNIDDNYYFISLRKYCFIIQNFFCRKKLFEKHRGSILLQQLYSCFLLSVFFLMLLTIFFLLLVFVKFIYTFLCFIFYILFCYVTLNYIFVVFRSHFLV
jgi:hypothetical protein